VCTTRISTNKVTVPDRQIVYTMTIVSEAGNGNENENEKEKEKEKENESEKSATRKNQHESIID
jgi:hypothetical protein